MTPNLADEEPIRRSRRPVRSSRSRSAIFRRPAQTPACRSAAMRVRPPPGRRRRLSRPSRFGRSRRRLTIRRLHRRLRPARRRKPCRPIEPPCRPPGPSRPSRPGQKQARMRPRAIRAPSSRRRRRSRTNLPASERPPRPMRPRWPTRPCRRSGRSRLESPRSTTRGQRRVRTLRRLPNLPPRLRPAGGAERPAARQSALPPVWRHVPLRRFRPFQAASCSRPPARSAASRMAATIRSGAA